MNIDFSPEERLRYSRNVLLREVGWSGQQRLKAGKVLVVGAGGIGSASLFYLAAAGVGHIGIVDSDTVEVSNLQRQILHRVDDLSRRKVDSARDSIKKLNPHCQVETFALRLGKANIHSVVTGYNLVLDASDNFPTRLLVSECCWQKKVPLVTAAVAEFTGLLLVVDPNRESPCYHCLLQEQPPAGSPEPPFGILGAVAGVMGCLQAVEVIKILLGLNSELIHQLLSYDALRSRFQIMARVKNAACPVCGRKPEGGEE